MNIFYFQHFSLSSSDYVHARPNHRRYSPNAPLFIPIENDKPKPKNKIDRLRLAIIKPISSYRTTVSANRKWRSCQQKRGRYRCWRSGTQTKPSYSINTILISYRANSSRICAKREREKFNSSLLTIFVFSCPETIPGSQNAYEEGLVREQLRLNWQPFVFLIAFHINLRLSIYFHVLSFKLCLFPFTDSPSVMHLNLAAFFICFVGTKMYPIVRGNRISEL